MPRAPRQHQPGVRRGRGAGRGGAPLGPVGNPHVELAERYIDGVLSGAIPACKWVKLACQRHRDDLKADNSADWPYRFDPAKAEKVCKFIELLPHTKGKWRKRDPLNPTAHLLRLEPWQCFIVCMVFGWVRKSDGFRRFRQVYVEVPRKNGKSALVAAIGIYMLCADGEEGAEVYAGATTEKQAWEVFGPAREMLINRPDVKDRAGISVNARNISIIAKAAKFEPVIGKPGDGASPSCSITDEYHEHATSEQFDTMVTGMGAREQPLALVITTAGDNIAGPCYDMRGVVLNVLQKVARDEELFGIVFTIDKGDDWADPAVIRKANPNCGVSISEEFLLARQREAINNPRNRGRFLTKHLNMWVNARSAYFDMVAWGRRADPSLRLEDFEGCRIVIGLDLASKVDIAALEILIPPEDEGGFYYTFGKHYLPEETVLAAENEHYQAWHADGWLEVTDGNITDFGCIEEDILDLCDRFQVEAVAYDPHQATMLVTRLQQKNVPVIEYRPLVLNFSEPMKELDALIRAGRLLHPGDPGMEWMMSNVVARPDKKDNVYPTKEKDEKKIDGPVALISALGVSMVGKADKEEESDYENQDLIIAG
ncbi:terminase large subunit [Azospirillum tabaci]|uniref:terminase large subunit n=1 Tax=Azospirillum tabaci TaxID=2752310 RepID=UPI0016602F75|nr:terminase TerL endonuclease subunit [Azospirillum tabaci]